MATNLINSAIKSITGARKISHIKKQGHFSRIAAKSRTLIIPVRLKII
jgi:hypothetical protein